jgi:peptidyl-dipeptidase Dcp
MKFPGTKRVSAHFALVFSILAAAGCAPVTRAPSSPAPIATGSNPLFTVSTLPYHAPRFDLIRDEHYEPAIEEGMRQQLAEIDVIAKLMQPPTFDNTIVAMERSGALLTRAYAMFSAVLGANTNDTLQKINERIAPKLAAHNDAIYLNDQLYRRVQSLYEGREALDLKPEDKRLLERYNRNFVRAGAKLSEAEKIPLKALNQEQSKLTAEFSNKLLAGTKANALVLNNRSELDGLSEAEIATAAEAAKSRGLTGKWVIPLQNTTQQPAQVSLKNRAVRQRLFELSTMRTERGDSTDTRAIVQRLAQIRAERAKILGYPNFAAYKLETEGAKTPENAIKLLTDLVPPMSERAKAEIAKMQAIIDAQRGGFKLAPWDWQYYAEQVRKADYDLDESQIKPYFEADRVLRDGVFFAANRLYGLTFRERKDIPVWHPDVRVFEVFEENGSPLALYYFDIYKRDNKDGGAWMNSFVDQSGLMGTKPVVYNVLNVTRPAPGQPALLNFREVTTMFHEFGHALHGMFSRVQYPLFSGTNVPRDFVEFPSQLDENWALEPVVFANYAKHHQTGQPIPQPLVDKIKLSRTFNQGFGTTESVAASLLDMAWHMFPAGLPPQDVKAVEAETLSEFKINVPEVPPRYRTTYFNHIWSSDGYAAGYYAYLWSEVLDHDTYAWFKENGGMTRANGQRYRDMILSRGGTEEADVLYRNFRGRDPRVDALLEQRGLIKPAEPTGVK